MKIKLSCLTYEMSLNDLVVKFELQMISVIN